MTGNSQAGEKLPASYTEFLKNLEEKTGPEDKVELILGYMRDTLAQKGVPRFKDFWEARKLFHPLLKECTNPLFKSKAWNDFTAMTVEARRLKEILDEQSSFSVEQIELALKAIEADLSDNAMSLAKVNLPKNVHAIARRQGEYSSLQSEINFLTTLSARLRALRKEVIETDMRIRQKNQLLKKISTLGDCFIPKRKTLIEKISSMFVEDVKDFEKRHFDGESRVSLRNLREEIKSLQTVSKSFSLSSKSFHMSREVLSRCWETLAKKSDEEREQWKEDHAKAEEILKELDPKIEAFVKSVSGGSLDPAQLEREREAMIEKIRKAGLARKIEGGLLKKVHGAVDCAMAKAREKEEAAEKKAKEESEKRKQSFFDALEKDATLEELEKLQADFEQDPCDPLLGYQFEFSIICKKEQAAQDGDLAAIYERLEKLQGALRSSVDGLRRDAGRSNLDFEAAILTSELLERGKALLEVVEAEIAQYEHE